MQAVNDGTAFCDSSRKLTRCGSVVTAGVHVTSIGSFFHFDECIDDGNEAREGMAVSLIAWRRLKRRISRRI